MFKNLVDSFLIIDAKDKPAPSFLTAYIFTWLVCNYQTTFAFVKTSGDLTTRFNASINTPIDYQWYWILVFTFVLVVSRFLLNNSIYYIREFIDNKTQGRLNQKGHKSFTSNADYQKLSTKISSLQRDLLSSQDREKTAKALENEATAAMLDLTIGRDKFKANYESELKIAAELHDTIDSQIEQRKADNINIESLKEDGNRLKVKNLALESDNVRINDHLGTILARLQAWVTNTQNDDIKLIGITRHEENKEVEGKISELLESIIISPNTSVNELDMQLHKIKASTRNTEGLLARIGATASKK